MDSKQKALAIIVVLGGIGLLAVSCSEDEQKEVAHHGMVETHRANGHEQTTAHKEEMDASHGGHSDRGHQPTAAPSLCVNGKQQSPIDLEAVKVGELPPLSFKYNKAPLALENNGYTAQFNYAAGSQLEVDAKTYNLVAVDFHSPSEHTVGGKHYALEAHLIHKNADGKQAVVAVMFDESDEANQTLAKLWLNMPANEGEMTSDSNITFNAADLLPQDLTYFNYNGSLTGGPCSEGVNWVVLATPNNIAKEQVKQFSDWFGDNARPLQSLNGRVVHLSN